MQKSQCQPQLCTIRESPASFSYVVCGTQKRDRDLIAQLLGPSWLFHLSSRCSYVGRYQNTKKKRERERKIAEKWKRKRLSLQGLVLSFISLLEEQVLIYNAFFFLLCFLWKCVHSTYTRENSTFYTFEGIQRLVVWKKVIMAQYQGFWCYWMNIYIDMTYMCRYVFECVYVFIYTYTHVSLCVCVYICIYCI